ncbi:MAG: D-alanyl-D-alanine carboxypeptidase, partial [Clostridia bacterium]|nr:D-alanyl-D-alanine carboxypeptidase [Clostridia bacterium]
MKKRIFSFVFSILLSVSVFFLPLTASAYEVTGVEINAKAGMLASLDTGEILYSNNIDKKVYPASITKIMTAVVILDSGLYNPDSKVTMTQEIINMTLGTDSAVSNLSAGEEITQKDLLHLVLMVSYGDCTLLAAQVFGGSIDKFVDKMNEKAAELGLNNTHYADPSGLHNENEYTTVADIYKLTLYALKNETFKSICETSRYPMPATNLSGPRTISTTNLLQDNTTAFYYQYAKGVKTGYTDEAGRCLVSTASYNGYNYICILMGCPNSIEKRYEFRTSANLFRWAFNNFSFKEIANSENPVCEVPVKLSFDTDFVPLYIEKVFISVLPNEADQSTGIKDLRTSNRIDFVGGIRG